MNFAISNNILHIEVVNRVSPLLLASFLPKFPLKYTTLMVSHPPSGQQFHAIPIHQLICQLEHNSV